MNKHIVKGLCFLLFYLLVNSNAVAQYSHTTATEQRTSRLQDSLAIRAMFANYTSLRLTDKEAAIATLLDIYNVSKAKNFNRSTYVALTELGYEFQIKGDYDRSVKFYTLALPYSNMPENKLYVDVVYSGIGMTYSSMGKYETALTYFNKALIALKDVNGPRNSNNDSSDIYNHIGVLWALLGEHTYAVNAFNQAERIAGRIHDTSMLVMVCLNVADIYLKKNDLNKGTEYYEKALAINPKNISPFSEVAILAGMATISDKKQEFARALKYLDKAESIIAKAVVPAYARVSIQATRGAVYLHMKDYIRAKPLLDSSLADAKAMKQIELLETLEADVAKLNAAMGNYDEAYKHLKAYASIKDSLYTNEKTRSLEIMVNSNMAEKDKAVVQRRLQIARQETVLQQRNIWMGGVIAGGLLLVALGIGLTLNYKNKQKVQQVQIYQLQQHQEISQLKAQVRGEEQERQRIARELHDSVASQLWAVNLNVESMQQHQYGDAAYTKKLNSISQQITDVTQDVWKTAQNLMPNQLLQEGLATALASVCQKTSTNTRLEVNFQEYGVVPIMDKEIELSIYRMVQELIQNVLKHAKNASSLLVQLSYMDSLLSITVEDNGVVFTERTNQDGMGLQQIRRRVQALKGSFDLQSIPGKGTTAYLEFDMRLMC